MKPHKPRFRQTDLLAGREDDVFNLAIVDAPDTFRALSEKLAKAEITHRTSARQTTLFSTR